MQKRECDRCKQQWEMDGDDDKLTATINISIPRIDDTPPSIAGSKTWTKNPSIDVVLDLCNPCARHTYKIATGE